jgi:ribosomal protein L37AE/L43A
MTVACFCGMVFEGEKCPSCGLSVYDPVWEVRDGNHVPHLCEVCERPLSAAEKRRGNPWKCNRCRESMGEFHVFLEDFLKRLR